LGGTEVITEESTVNASGNVVTYEAITTSKGAQDSLTSTTYLTNMGGTATAV
jgi:hypothetical protein